MEPWTLTDPDLAHVFACLQPYAHAVLAVSGGSDSIALLFLAARWARLPEHSAPQITVATVDHGLRHGSAEEAQRVVEVARRLGFRAELLTWRGEKPALGIQERARAARYELLCACAIRSGAGRCAVVTAHTRDDQAETVLMRLARGSGPDGLQGMAAVRRLTPHAGVDLVRPLLGVPRARLRSYLAAEAVSYSDDPSNDDVRFERVRWRAAEGVLTDLGLTAPMIALAARRQRRAVEALDIATDRIQAATLDLNGGMFASIDGAVFAAQPEDIRVRLMLRILSMFGGSSPPADLAQIEHLVVRLAVEDATQTTLGGCDVRACRHEIRVFRERGRARLQPIELRPGEETMWDGRFRIRVTGGDATVIVRALDPVAARLLRRNARSRLLLPARAAATLPAVWAGEDLVSVGGVPREVMLSAMGDNMPRVDISFVAQMAPSAP
jgi:tRNA(Ile)-lysidine synthase